MSPFYKFPVIFLLHLVTAIGTIEASASPQSQKTMHLSLGGGSADTPGTDILSINSDFMYAYVCWERREESNERH